MAKILVIGGGLFGCVTGLKVAEVKDADVTIIERCSDTMMGASRCNHNRLHLGYHYLRSSETANQSLEGLISFLFEFGSCVVTEFPNFYAIASEDSLTGVVEFKEFCDGVGISYQEDFPSKDLLNRNVVSGCFKVPEPVFDFRKLKKTVLSKLFSKSNLKLEVSCYCESIVKVDGGFEVIRNGVSEFYDYIVNATYDGVNEVCSLLDLPRLRLKYQDVYIPKFIYPAERFGLTVMDGPFCSVMPHGVRDNEFLLYHVSKSVLASSVSKSNQIELSQVTQDVLDSIYKQSEVFYPFLKNAVHVDGLQTIRAVVDSPADARVSELFEYDEMPGFYSVLSGKISTCLQVGLLIKRRIEGDKQNSLIRI